MKKPIEVNWFGKPYTITIKVNKDVLGENTVGVWVKFLLNDLVKVYNFDCERVGSGLFHLYFKRQKSMMKCFDVLDSMSEVTKRVFECGKARD